jgi:tetratricopeptide (TPR) repeat protein
MKRDFNGAIGWYEKALIINKKLSKKQPKLYKRKLADNYYNRGLCFSKCPEKIESAVNDYEMARELFQKLSDYDPEVYRPKLSNVLASFVNLRTQQGQKDESEKMYKEAIGLLASSLKLELQIEKDKKNGQNGSNNASKDEAVKRRYNDIIKVLEKLSELHNKDDISLSFAEIVTVYVLKSDFKKSNELIEEIKGSIQYKSRLLSCWSEIEKLEILSDEQKKYIEKKREELK